MAVKLPTVPKVTSIIEYVEFVMQWRREGLPPLVFRGQRASHWKALPTLLRPSSTLIEHEKEMVRDLVSMHPQEFSGDATMFDRLVRMQHYNLPTRLLDVTSNPLVALWFATEPAKPTDGGTDGKVIGFWVPDYRQKYFDSEVVSCLANLANLTSDEKLKISGISGDTVALFNKRSVVRRLTYFIRQEKSDFSPKIIPVDLFRPVYVKPKLANRRILAQSGAFIIYGLQVDDKPYDRDLVSKFLRVPEESKGQIRDELQRLGVHASALFPEIDKAADYISGRYL